jgi:hypothetical protein
MMENGNEIRYLLMMMMRLDEVIFIQRTSFARGAPIHLVPLENESRRATRESNHKRWARLLQQFFGLLFEIPSYDDCFYFSLCCENNGSLYAKMAKRDRIDNLGEFKMDESSRRGFNSFSRKDTKR